MLHLIDSDIFIDYLDGHPVITPFVESLGPDDFAIGVVTFMEVYEGLLRRPDAEEVRRRFDAFVAVHPALSFTPEIATRCAVLRDDLRRRNRPVRSRYLDLINAATALEYGLTLITRTRDDYADVPGLVLT